MQATSSCSEFPVAYGRPGKSPPVPPDLHSRYGQKSVSSTPQKTPPFPHNSRSNNKQSCTSAVSSVPKPGGEDDGDDEEEESRPMTRQPETRPITQEQLIHEVKGIYAGLVMVEKKCGEIDQQQAATTSKLTNEQWQALIALHRTLLHEHHDFFLASQHPSASVNLKKLATKYAMPARMWRYGIHSFLELLRHRLPHSLEHMLSFIYIAYSMMALLKESVPSFEETWIECLGDLARYRMAIEEYDMKDREVWAGVARMWYNKAADKSPNVGRIQHHLAVLARPNIVQQLFYYSKALVSAHPFPNASESILLLFNPFLADGESASQRYPLVESTFVKAAAVRFSRGSIASHARLAHRFLSLLDGHINKASVRFRVQGPEMASSLCASLFDFGNLESPLWEAFANHESHSLVTLDNLDRSTAQNTVSPEQKCKLQEDQRHAYLESLKKGRVHLKAVHSNSDSTTKDATFSGAQDAIGHACHLFYLATELVLSRTGDKNILPFAHVVLAFLNSLTYVRDGLPYIEAHVPWETIVNFLNNIGRSGAVESRFEGSAFPQPRSGTGRQLPEDFIMRGLVWAKHYFPHAFFEGQVVDEDERTLELPSHITPRTERCLWLGIQLASLERWITYDPQSKEFSITALALGLGSGRNSSLDNRSPTMSVEREDIYMIDINS